MIKGINMFMALHVGVTVIHSSLFYRMEHLHDGLIQLVNFGVFFHSQKSLYWDLKFKSVYACVYICIYVQYQFVY